MNEWLIEAVKQLLVCLAPDQSSIRPRLAELSKYLPMGKRGTAVLGAPGDTCNDPKNSVTWTVGCSLQVGETPLSYYTGYRNVFPL